MEQNVVQRLKEWEENLAKDIKEYCEKYLFTNNKSEDEIRFNEPFEVWLISEDHDGPFLDKYIAHGLTLDGNVIVTYDGEIEEDYRDISELTIRGMANITDELNESAYTIVSLDDDGFDD